VMVQLKDVINTMVDKLWQFAKEATCVSQEVGTEGSVLIQPSSSSCYLLFSRKLGVDKLAANLTSQVIRVAHNRDISSFYIRFDQ
jgi:hypothetical protein